MVAEAGDAALPTASAADLLGTAATAADLAGLSSSPHLAQAAQAAQLLQQAGAGLTAFDAPSAQSAAVTPPFNTAAPTPAFDAAAAAPPTFTPAGNTETVLRAPDPAPVTTFAQQIPVFDLPSAFTPPDFQDNRRLFQLFTLLPADKRLFLDSLRGYEELSAPFEFDLRLASLNASIELKELISKPIAVGVRQSDGTQRYIHGYAKSFAFEMSDAGWAYYRATVVPWTHFLTLRQDSRIFQKKRVPDILEEVFKEYGSAADFELRLSRSYEPIDFIVQYQESDFNLVCRLMEREGITFYFEHRLDGHKLILTDDTLMAAHCAPLPTYPSIEFNGGDRVAAADCVSQLQAVRELQPGKVTLDTYDYQSPRGMRVAEVPTVANQGEAPRLEVYDGTPGYAYKDRSDGERYARLRMEGFEARAKYFAGSSDCPDFTPGFTFALTGHFWFDPLKPEEDRLLLVRVEHQGRNNIVAEDGAIYSNQFTCQRHKVAFRPEARHSKPVIPGLQSAVVTGPPGQEIWTNEHGCIKVRFHWDRRARFDDSSSCWIRVAQPWAGQGWGTVAIPRIGQEVVVGFMEGDADRPLVLGSLYNSDMPLPYQLPAGAHMMGFKSNSTPGGGGFCEMVIHDQAGKELINIHSQKDMVTTVQNNQATVVNGPQQTTTVTKGLKVTKVHKAIQVESETEHIHVKASTYITLEVGKSTITMDKNGNIHIKGTAITVEGDTITSTATGMHDIQGAPIHLNK
ncbi:type VI secretion system tip protein TssI/VgrG [Aquabacterium sp. A7-Y]|uniref:type VI secretion system Vgr family protein n=1 Tax=Aquabacterium sp. A7-Y TaxID=1349605 RepID=UPI00223E1C2B|nr:type VI secretion system tip protein TssI/VgrG [Aquabacterium sp. A7-Y]MCW7540923.1 type VI secretion system tip protein TssI/VgrG [Aquabacterium sp. A7-Y]